MIEASNGITVSFENDGIWAGPIALSREDVDKYLSQEERTYLDMIWLADHLAGGSEVFMRGGRYCPMRRSIDRIVNVAAAVGVAKRIEEAS